MKNKRLAWENKFQTYETTEAKARRQKRKDTMAEKVKTGRTGKTIFEGAHHPAPPPPLLSFL